MEIPYEVIDVLESWLEDKVSLRLDELHEKLSYGLEKLNLDPEVYKDILSLINSKFNVPP